MADVSNELIYEVIKPVQARLGNFEESFRELRGEVRAFRGNAHAIQTQMGSSQVDIANIHETIGALDTRLSRIERRLDFIDTPVP